MTKMLSIHEQVPILPNWIFTILTNTLRLPTPDFTLFGIDRSDCSKASIWFMIFGYLLLRKRDMRMNCTVLLVYCNVLHFKGQKMYCTELFCTVFQRETYLCQEQNSIPCMIRRISKTGLHFLLKSKLNWLKD